MAMVSKKCPAHEHKWTGKMVGDKGYTRDLNTGKWVLTSKFKNGKQYVRNKKGEWEEWTKNWKYDG